MRKRKGKKMEKNRIKADCLVKTFTRNEKKNKKVDINAVDGISLSIGEGEIVGILGPNGAGKTTLLRMMSKLMRPTSGMVSIQIGEKEITDDIEVKRHIGYLSNNTKLYGRLSSRELLRMLGVLYGMSKEDTEKKIEEICEILSMGSFIDNRIEKLSTGQTQRASIARCLVHDPQVYIFDEPTLGLDILSSAAIIDFMKKERGRGKTILYSTHYMEEAEYLCDRILMIHRGKIISEGAPEGLKTQTGKGNLRDVFAELIEKEGIADER
jgi:sodium transport system ATP-binding protein